MAREAGTPGVTLAEVLCAEAGAAGLFSPVIGHLARGQKAALTQNGLTSQTGQTPDQPDYARSIGPQPHDRAPLRSARTRAASRRAHGRIRQESRGKVCEATPWRLPPVVRQARGAAVARFHRRKTAQVHRAQALTALCLANRMALTVKEKQKSDLF